MMVPGVPLTQLLQEYERQCAVSNEIIAAHPLDEVGKHPDFDAAAATLRWMIIHMVEETARHAGHLDAMRELLDGQKGYYDRRCAASRVRADPGCAASRCAATGAPRARLAARPCAPGCRYDLAYGLT